MFLKPWSYTKPLILWLQIVIATLLLSLLPSQQGFARSQKLSCSKTFPCTPEVRRRALFWMQVFSRWNNNQVVLHDSAHPERVYAVMRSKQGCGRRRSSRLVEKKRKKIRRQLLQLAAKGNSGSYARSREGRRLLKLFVKPTRRQLRSAAGRIRCQQGNKDRFRQALKRFGRYRLMVEKVLHDARLPTDLKYLPFVESAYNPSAYSRVGAAGLWQIMPRTARSLGLQTGVALDERLDPQQATLAAARFFRNSTDSLLPDARRHRPRIKTGDLMPFVVTSYNYGINGMRRAVKKIGPDFGRVLSKYRSPQFQTAVKNFYASFLAARQVASHQKHYFPGVVAERPLRYTAVSLQRAASAKRLAKVFSVPVSTLRKLNPALTPTVWKNWQLVPSGYRLNLPSRTTGKRAKLRRLAQLPPETLRAIRYRVRRGDTVCGIAARFAVSCTRLLARNQLNKRSLIRAGQKLYVPSRRQAKIVRLASKKKYGRLSRVRKKTTLAHSVPVIKTGATYIVKRGESICRIAQRLPISCQQLLRINGLNQRSVVRPGQRLRLSMPVRVASTAPKVEVTQPVTRISTSRRTAGSATTPKAVQTVKFRDLIKPPDAELDIQIHVKKTRSGTRYLIRVQPEETLGHYADWLGLGSTRKIKRRNHITRRHPLRVGQWLQLPVLHQSSIDKFEHKRAGFHALLVNEFRNNFRLQRIRQYALKKGDSAWHLSQRFEVPWWLLTRMNPELLEPSLQLGHRIRIPVIQPK